MDIKKKIKNKNKTPPSGSSIQFDTKTTHTAICSSSSCPFDVSNQLPSILIFYLTGNVYMSKSRRIQTFINSFLQCTLKVLKLLLNQFRGILLFRIKTLFAKVFSPTFFLWLRVAMKEVCREVRIWLKFKHTHSWELVFPFISL